MTLPIAPQSPPPAAPATQDAGTAQRAPETIGAPNGPTTQARADGEKVVLRAPDGTPVQDPVAYAQAQAERAERLQKLVDGYKTAEQLKADEDARKRGDFEAIERQYKQQLEDREKAIVVAHVESALASIANQRLRTMAVRELQASARFDPPTGKVTFDTALAAELLKDLGTTQAADPAANPAAPLEPTSRVVLPPPGAQVPPAVSGTWRERLRAKGRGA